MTTTQRHPVHSPLQGISIATLPILQPDFDFNDTTLFAVYCFIKNFVGIAKNAPSVVDKKIEDAMECVKESLRFSVNAEIDVLRERIAVLLDRISLLEKENRFLKGNADPDILRILYGQDAKDPAWCLNPSDVPR